MKKTLLSTLVLSCLSLAPLSSFAADYYVDYSASHIINQNDDFSVSFGFAVSDELSQLLQAQGGKITRANLTELLNAIFSDKGWDVEHGVAGVKVLELTDTMLKLGFNDTAASITFNGDNLLGLINTTQNINLKDNRSRLAIFDAEDDKSSFWIGGGRNDAAQKVSELFAELTGGSKIQGYEVKGLLKSGLDGASMNTEGFTLIGINRTSFTLAVKESTEKRVERIVFTGNMAVSAINELVPSTEGLLLDTGDCKIKHADWNTNLYGKIWLSNGNNDLNRLVGHTMKLDEIKEFVPAVKDNALEGVTLMSTPEATDHLTVKIENQKCPSSYDTLHITGYHLEQAIAETNPQD